MEVKNPISTEIAYFLFHVCRTMQLYREYHTHETDFPRHRKKQRYITNNDKTKCHIFILTDVPITEQVTGTASGLRTSVDACKINLSSFLVDMLSEHSYMAWCIYCGLFSFIVPRLFEEKRGDIVFGFPWCVVRGSWCVVPSL